MIVFLDAILEIPATRFGLFAYPGAPYSLTLWAGKYYQFPIYENIFMNFNYLSIGLLRFYRDDKGESLAERGVSTMRLPEAAKTGLRFLALVGFCNIRSEEHTSELQSLMRISYAVFCLKKKKKKYKPTITCK